MPITRNRSTWRLTWVWPLLALVGLLSASCGATATPTPPTPVSSHGGPVVDYVSLIDALRKAGLTVNAAGNIKQPFLSVPGQSLKVNNQDLQAYEYPDNGAAQRDAGKIQPDGTIAGASVMWVAQPHFYSAGRIIVIYVGTDATVLSALDSALGKPFATGPNFHGPGNPTPTP